MTFPTKTFGTTNPYYYVKKRLGLKYRRCRPMHYKSDAQAKERFKEDLPFHLENLSDKYGSKARLFFEDEHRMGEQPIQYKHWSFTHESTQSINIGYKWLWDYAFVEPSTGENHHYLMSHLNKISFRKTLDLFVKEAKVSKRAPVLLVVDGATAHNLRSEEIPEGLEILKLPPYSPDLQPVERIWKIVNQSISNRCNAKFDVMVERISERCKWMMEYGVDLVRRVTSFYWLPTV